MAEPEPRRPAVEPDRADVIKVEAPANPGIVTCTISGYGSDGPPPSGRASTS